MTSDNNKSLSNFENFLLNHFSFDSKIECPILVDSMKYSLFSGGKRFRPQLIQLVCEALDIKPSDYIPFAAAVECIHTYSLIHDDLPCMDDDSERRGKPTNHIKYGETTALLAGDGLLTEAFHIIGKYYTNKPSIGLKLVQLLSYCAGPQGMVAGQQLDLLNLDDKNKKNNDDFKINEKSFSAENILMIHKLKTAALIKCCAEGAAIIAQVSPDKQYDISEAGELIGLAFQIKDDFLDFDEKNPEPCNLINLIGATRTQEILNDVSNRAIQLL